MSYFKDKVIYQIYIKSFYDTDGDGIGDISGITKKLNYIAELGVDMIWINPFYPSPQKDNGYDVSEYKSINPVFGTMQDFEQLINSAKQKNIGIMLDMILNHTSSEHIWFKKALEGDKYYKDFYFFKKETSIGDRPTNWKSKFGGNVWQKIENSNEYYLHLFDVSQPDLNWDNKNLRKELYDIVNFWLDKGVKGLRFDVINLISKPNVFEDDFIGDGRRFYTDGPNIHFYLKELNKNTFGNKEIITVGEMSSTNIEDSAKYSNEKEKEFSMIFHFHHLKCDYPNGEKWTLGKMDFEQLKDIFHTWQVNMSDKYGWEALFWNNHDQPRAISRFDFPKENHYLCTTLLAATIHFMRGTPFIYMGEEIGMTNPDFDCIEFYKDIETLNYYNILNSMGLIHDEIMKIIRSRSRDNSRIPMQWNSSKNAGFTTGEPWINASSNKDIINVKLQQNKENTTLTFYKKLIKLRKKYKVIQEGNYIPILKDIKNIIAYKRQYNNDILVSMHNYCGSTLKIDLNNQIPKNSKLIDILIDNYDNTRISDDKQLSLKPYQTITILST